MQSIPVVYEQGSLRPLEPVALPEGAHVQVLILDSPTEEDYAAMLNILDRIADMPLEGENNVAVSQEYEAILYPKEGEAP